MSAPSLMKEIHSLMRNIGSISGDQARVKSWDPDDACNLVVEIQPSDGYYKGGVFDFKIEVSDNFPNSAPIVSCLTPIYHPNIDATQDFDNICLNILSSDWESTLGLEDCIQGLLFLLHNPNLEDPLPGYFDAGLSSDDFALNVRRTIRGDQVDLEGYGRFIDGNYVEMADEDEDESEANSQSSDAVAPRLQRTVTVSLSLQKNEMGEKVCSVTSSSQPSMARIRSFNVRFIHTNSSVPGCVQPPGWLLRKIKTYAGSSQVTGNVQLEHQEQKSELAAVDVQSQCPVVKPNLQHLTTM